MGYFDDAVSALRRGLSIGGDLDATASMTRELSVALVITRQFEAAARQLLLFLTRHPTAFPALIADAVTFAASVPAAASSLPLSHNSSKLLVDFGQLFINVEEEEARAMKAGASAMKAGASEAKKHKIELTNDAPHMWAVIAGAKGALFAAKAASAAANLLHIAAASTPSLPPTTRSHTWNVLGHFLHEVGGDRLDAVMALGTAALLPHCIIVTFGQVLRPGHVTRLLAERCLSRNLLNMHAPLRMLKRRPLSAKRKRARSTA